MRLFVIALILVVNGVSAREYSLPVPTAGEVNTELVSRSGLSEAVLANVLSNCDANQQSMNICAQRDFVAADLVLVKLEKEKLEQFPTCAEKLKKRIELFEKNRNKCTASSNNAYGDASMKSLAQSQCFTAETQKMSKKLGCFDGCKTSKVKTNEK